MAKYICPQGHGSVDKSRDSDGAYRYYYPRCWDCGKEAVDLDALLQFAEEQGFEGHKFKEDLKAAVQRSHKGSPKAMGKLR